MNDLPVIRVVCSVGESVTGGKSVRWLVRDFRLGTFRTRREAVRAREKARKRP